MWQSDLAIGSSVLYSTDGLPTPPSEQLSPPRNYYSLDISLDHRRKRVSGASSEPARKHVVPEHKFDNDKAPMNNISLTLKIVSSFLDMNRR